jgi:hypothetical protein
MQKKPLYAADKKLFVRRPSNTQLSRYRSGLNCHYFVTTAGSKWVKSDGIR